MHGTVLVGSETPSTICVSKSAKGAAVGVELGSWWLHQVAPQSLWLVKTDVVSVVGFLVGCAPRLMGLKSIDLSLVSSNSMGSDVAGIRKNLVNRN